MKLSDLLKSVTTLTGSDDGIAWYPIRPQTAENTFFIQRAKAAWGVLTGKADAVEWDFPVNKNYGAASGRTLQAAPKQEK